MKVNQGGGKGALLSENKSLTLATANDQILFQPIGFQPTDGGFANFNNDGKSTTLKASDPPAVAYDQPDIIGMVNLQGSKSNAVTSDGEQSYTLNAMHGHDVHAVAYEQTFIAQEITVNEPLAIDGYNQTLNKTMQTIRADKSDGDHVGMIMNETVVRRLTPTECERLQGFPDDWTAQRIDHKTGNVIEQKDSARYKQMGNAVAVPCVQWLLARIVERMDDV